MCKPLFAIKVITNGKGYNGELDYGVGTEALREYLACYGDEGVRDLKDILNFMGRQIDAYKPKGGE